MNLHDVSVTDYITMVHSQTAHDNENEEFYDPEEIPPDPPNDDILAYATKQQLPHGDIRKVLSSVGTSPGKKPPPKGLPSKHGTNKTTDVSFASTITIDGKKYREVNMLNRTQYSVSKHTSSAKGSLIDRGANGGLAGSDVRIVHKTAAPRYVDDSGIDSSVLYCT